MEWRNEELDLETSGLPAGQQRRTVAERTAVRV
jgi:hypothetical protein